MTADTKATERPWAPFGINAFAMDQFKLERQRQRNEEHWTLDHDDQHKNGELLNAGISYYVHAKLGYEIDRNRYIHSTPLYWPWSLRWWKPKTPLRDLERAGGLVLAEKERLLRNSPNAFTDECDQRLRWCAELYAELIARAVNSYDPALQDKHTKAVKALKDTRELALDAIAAIRESSRALRRDALDQMELHASQGSTSEVSRYSTEAERHGAALNAAKSALHATAKVFDTALRSIKESEHG